MANKKNRGERISLIAELQERAKELNCLYRIEELLTDVDRPIEEALTGIVEALPPGWQFPEICEACIVYREQAFETKGYIETPYPLSADIAIQDEIVGTVTVCYTSDAPEEDNGPFLKEEVKLIRTIADRLGHFALHKKLKEMFNEATASSRLNGESSVSEWTVAIELLRKTDRDLLYRVSRKMINYLLLHGITEAESLLNRYGKDYKAEKYLGESNQPYERASRENLLRLSEETFHVASKHLVDEDIIEQVQKWIHEDKSSFLIKPMVNVHASLTQISDAIQRYQHFKPEGIELSSTAAGSVRVALVRRFFTDHLDFIRIAKQFVEPEDFFDLIERVIYPTGSHGKLGGKSAGLFLSHKIIQKLRSEDPALGQVKVPRTWYITSDGMHEFVYYNNLEEVYDQKYKQIDEVRQEYPHIVQVLKNSYFPKEIVKGLSMALDDFGDVPLIVRSSSLLEDRLGSAFSGKYRSLFLANQGEKKQRLEALMDAIAEVYASTFSPDPIEYRAERGLLDFNEQMGIMIQEVVGKRAGPYFFPSFAGVAFSNNEFRWSPRIKRTDGLLRIVPGLGTRAVDRLSDDYPILVAPGQPKLRVNVTADEIVRYSPNKIDLINLESNRFETRSVRDLLAECKDAYPGVNQVFSVHQQGMLQRPMGMITNFNDDDVVVTFDGLITSSSFVEQIKAILANLQKTMETPVDIEFASDGTDLYLLQCRPQSRTNDDVAASIPRDVHEEDVVFTANRYISNGRVPDLTHLVYVDPSEYSTMVDRTELSAIGQVVGKLNKLLPKRQFALIGPGRWGSRGDIKLGVRVTYSDINNTALLVEVARKKGNYVPDLSFGTHFFQDLVEASIRYLPLYPDDEGIQFNETFLKDSPNILMDVLPEFHNLSMAVRVIDIPAATGGKVLRVLMNAEEDEAVGLLVDPSTPVEVEAESPRRGPSQTDDHWRWRLNMAERIAAEIEPENFGVVALYIFGSVKNASAGPGSDIDLLVHFRGNDGMRRDLEKWLQGWSLCLDELNYLRTGYRSGGLLDVHIITDESIECRNSFAVKIGAVTDAARKLPLGR